MTGRAQADAAFMGIEVPEPMPQDKDQKNQKWCVICGWGHHTGVTCDYERRILARKQEAMKQKQQELAKLQQGAYQRGYLAGTKAPKGAAMAAQSKERKEIKRRQQMRANRQFRPSSRKQYSIQKRSNVGPCKPRSDPRYMAKNKKPSCGSFGRNKPSFNKGGHMNTRDFHARQRMARARALTHHRQSRVRNARNAKRTTLFGSDPARKTIKIESNGLSISIKA